MSEGSGSGAGALEPGEAPRVAIDAIPVAAAIVAHDGTTIAVNPRWGRESGAGWLGQPVRAGDNLLDACARSTEPTGRLLGEKLRDVLSGRSEFADHDHPGHGPAGEGSLSVQMARAPAGAVVLLVPHGASRRELAELQLQHQLLVESQQLGKMGSFRWFAADDRVEWSDEMYRIFGVPPGSPVTMELIFNAIHPDDRARVAAATAAARAQGGQALDFRIVHPDGTLVNVRAIGREARDAEGRVLYVVGTYQDISAEAEAMAGLRRSEARFRGLVDAAVDYVVLVSTDLKIEFVNRVDEGFVLDEVIGSSVLAFYPPETAVVIERQIRGVFESRRPTIFETAIVGASPRCFQISVGPIVDRETGEIKGATFIARDISSAKEREELLRHQSETMQRLAEAVSAGEQKIRRDITRTLHDDLQQILVALKLKAGGRRPGEEGDLSALIAGCLDSLSRLTTEVSPIMASDSLDDALRWLVARVKRTHGLAVRYEGTPVNLAPSVRAMVFDSVRELLLNVIKHAGILEAALLISEEAGRLRVAVTDEGRGFDASVIHPNGFGLRVLRDRVFALGGTLEIAFRPGRGTSATLTVAVASGGEGLRPHDAPPDAHSPRARPIRVLVVDDHAIFRRQLVDTLAFAPDVEVVGEAANGRDGVEATARLAPDLVLMDVEMPEMNGVEATREIRRAHPTVRVVAVSVHSEEEVGERMRQVGASALLPKTSSPSDIFDSIRSLFRA